jgi:hypothetical protein
MAPAFGELKYSTVAVGDAVGIVGTSLLSVANQLITAYGKALVAYNSANPALPLPLVDTNNDPETSLRTNTFTLLASKVYNTTTFKFENKFATYVEAYAKTPWVTPTTGSFQGCTTLAEAVHLAVNACKMAYDLLQPNPFIADPSGLVSIADNSDGGIEHTLQYLMEESLDAVTGNTIFKINDLLKLVDDQQGV